jgi:hypothetical protein
MAGVRLFGRRRPGDRRYCVIIEVTYAGGRLADDRRDMLTAQINLPAPASKDLAVTVSPDAVSILTVSATVDAANHRVALAVVDEALDQALMMTGLFEEFDVTGKVLRAAPLERADRIRPQSAGAGPAAV